MATSTSTIDSLTDLAAEVKRTKAAVRTVRDRIVLLRSELDASQDELRLALEAEYGATDALIKAASDG